MREWNERPLKEAYPFVIVDAIVLKVRKGGQVRPQSALIAESHQGGGCDLLDSSQGLQRFHHRSMYPGLRLLVYLTQMIVTGGKRR